MTASSCTSHLLTLGFVSNPALLLNDQANLNRWLCTDTLGNWNPSGTPSGGTGSRLEGSRKGDIRVFVPFLLCPCAISGRTSVLCNFSTQLGRQNPESRALVTLSSLLCCYLQRWQRLPWHLGHFIPPCVPSKILSSRYPIPCIIFPPFETSADPDFLTRIHLVHVATDWKMLKFGGCPLFNCLEGRMYGAPLARNGWGIWKAEQE